MAFGVFTVSVDDPVIVTLPVSFANSSYSVVLSLDTSSGNWVGSDNIGTGAK